MNLSTADSDCDDAIFVGVDVGGTNTKLGLITASGKIIAEQQIPTRQDRGPDQAMQRSAEAVRRLLANHQIDHNAVIAVGLGTPGSMDIPQGMLLAPPNLPSWKNFPIRDALAQALEIPVVFNNDANAAAMGEYWLGGGKKFQSLVFLTLGTGVGGGMIINDFLIAGSHSLGGEIGHVTVDTSPEARVCGCGIKGHLEAYAGAAAIVDRYCLMLGNQQLDPVPSPLDICRAAEAGDAIAIRVIEETANYLATGIAIIAHLIDPEIVLLGGAVTFGGDASPAGRRFLQTIRHHVVRDTFPAIGENLKIEFATLGGAAGWIGAAALARQEFKQEFKDRPGTQDSP